MSGAGCGGCGFNGGRGSRTNKALHNSVLFNAVKCRVDCGPVDVIQVPVLLSRFFFSISTRPRNELSNRRRGRTDWTDGHTGLRRQGQLDSWGLERTLADFESHGLILSLLLMPEKTRWLRDFFTSLRLA